MTKFLWKIGGEAGFGIMTSGLMFSKLATRSGYHIYDYTEYPSLIRGGHNTYEVLISDSEIGATQRSVDILVCLNEDTYKFHKDRLSNNSIVVYDEESFKVVDEVIKAPVPFKNLLTELKGSQLMANTIALGVSAAFLGADIEVLFSLIEEQFGRKGEEIINFNKQFAKKGYDFVNQNYPNLIKHVLNKRQDKEKVVMTGNEAFSFGAVAADCRFYAAYPMTPTSNVLSVLAEWQTKTGMVVRHAEDEISVINTALGASHAGVRSAVGTSGGGFALMVEAISLAGIAEIPIVIFLGQRPGPATGMPTWTEQGDLLFACHAGHGEFPKIVLAPGDVHEMMSLTIKAFNLADIYQLPVIVLGDKLLCESHQDDFKESVDKLLNERQINRGKTVKIPSEKPYLRYKLTDDGISERLIPGAAGVFYQANSYEHLEDSHTTEDSKPRQDQVQKRNKKWTTYLAQDFELPKIYGDMAKAATVFISWGGNKGTIIEAQKQLKEQGKETTYIHFTHMYPLHEGKVRELLSQEKRYVLIENNSHGQFGQLLRMQTGIEIKEKFLKYDGRPIWVEDIVNYINKI